MKKDVFAYELGDSLYINLTNKCTNNCSFCIRHGSSGVEDYDLWLEKEPDADDVIAQMGDISRYDEIVFCGFGEPTMSLDVLKRVALFAHDNNKPVRLNTNGLASIYYGRDIAKELNGLIDTMSISLNAYDAKSYEALCLPQFGMDAFPAVLDFAKKCVEYGIPNVIFSVVDVLDDESIKKCRAISEKTGVPLRVRYHTG